mmetsp:Transcript_20718/g.26746  ORF Transcript_20718/g.26746 Transcript_20718/m.26746 type:complete len:104 (-) Transcript_20718:12-323(-)
MADNNNNYESKIAKLQAATETAEHDLQQAEVAWKDSQMRLSAAKELLQELNAKEQETIQINDTKLPELLELHALAQNRYDTAKARYETNQRYLQIYQAKAANK